MKKHKGHVHKIRHNCVFQENSSFFLNNFCVPELQTLKFRVFQIAVRGGFGEHSPQWGGGGELKFYWGGGGLPSKENQPEK